MSSVIDFEARQEALNPRKSFIVQAPAGSGKTELLTQRYLALLAGVEQPEHILAITFTRKAASEMRERIIHSLRTCNPNHRPEQEPKRTNWALSREVLKRNAAQNWQLIENPQRMMIQTIDAFYSGLIKRMPAISGLGSDAITEENTQEFYTTAAENTLKLLQDKTHGPVIEKFLLLLDGNRSRASRLLAEMLSKRDQWMEYLVQETDLDYFREMIEMSLENQVLSEIDDLCDLLDISEINALSRLANYAIVQLRRHHPESAIFPSYLGQAEQLDLGPISLENLANWREVANWVLIGDGSKLRSRLSIKEGFPPKTKAENAQEKLDFEDAKAEMKVLLDELAGREDYFQRLKQLPQTTFDEHQWNNLTHFISCLKLSLAQLKLLFAERDKLDFQETAIRVSQALDSEETDLGLILDYQIQHILIDEFQDTSQSQYRMLGKIVREWQPEDRKTLFLVGDPMQSIYRFREADVGLFLKAGLEGIGPVRLEKLNLSVNFRSHKGIVDWVNATFEAMFPEHEDIYRGAVTYSHSVPHDNSAAGVVESLVFEDSLEEAAHLAELISQQLDQKPHDNIAILVRNRSHLAELVPALQAQGIRYQATEIEVLGSRPVITDLLNLMQLLLDPTDRIAWLALLRGPWCGLTLADLLLVAGEPESIIWHNCQNQKLVDPLSADGKQRLELTLGSISPWLERTLGTLSRRLEACWMALDGPAYLDSDTDLDAAGLFFELLNEITTAEQIIDSKTLHESLQRLFAPADPKADSRVQIMTIHKSKGLQFDTVIVPSLQGRSGQDKHSLLRWMSVPDGLLMAPLSFTESDEDGIYKYLQDIDKKRQKYEQFRLVYVACTRAKTRLILSTTPKTNKKGLVITSGTFLADLWPILESQVQEFKTELPEQAEDEALLDNRLWRHHAAKRLITEAPIDPYVVPPRQQDQASQTLTFDASISRRAIGTVCHAWLERIGDQLEHWPESRLESQIAMIKQQLRSLSVPGHEIEGATEEVLQQLKLTLSCEMGRYILASHPESQSELAIERREQGQVRFYVIDRTFVDAEGCRWIVDYKTSSHEGAGLDNFLDIQVEKYRNQLNNYASLMAALEPRPIKLMLYFTQYQQYTSWEWQAN